MGGGGSATRTESRDYAGCTVRVADNVLQCNAKATRRPVHALPRIRALRAQKTYIFFQFQSVHEVPAVAAASVSHSAAVGGSVVGVVGLL